MSLHKNGYKLTTSWFIAFTCLTYATAQEPGRQPNVLMIAVDDLGCTLGCYGDVLARTPHIDRLATDGICFQRAYNQIPLCNPTRASLLTGLRPDQTQVFDLERHFRDELPNVVTLPQAFMRAGYYVARVGKIYHYNVPNAIGTAGLDDPASWQHTVNPRGRDVTDEALITNAEPHRPISGALSWLPAEGSDREQTDGMIVDAAIEIMREQRSTPFFLGVGFFRPHTPYVAPQKYFDLYPLDQLRLPYTPSEDRDDIPLSAFAHNCPVPNYNLPTVQLLAATQAYYACVSFVDAQVGRLLAALEDLQLREDTIVVLWSDHGYHLGEHGGVWQKRTLFEQSARAPLIIDYPRATASGPCRRVVEFVDIYPTLVELAAVAGPSELAGRSLVPLLHNPLKEWNGVAVTQILRPADSRLTQPVMGCSLRTERYRYTEWGAGEFGSELYDHQVDPGEFNNLAAAPDKATQRLIHQLQPLLHARASGKVPTTPVNPAKL
jgi:iduronate 2-sulfatase